MSGMKLRSFYAYGLSMMFVTSALLVGQAMGQQSSSEKIQIAKNHLPFAKTLEDALLVKSDTKDSQVRFACFTNAPQFLADTKSQEQCCDSNCCSNKNCLAANTCSKNLVRHDGTNRSNQRFVKRLAKPATSHDCCADCDCGSHCIQPISKSISPILASCKNCQRTASDDSVTAYCQKMSKLLAISLNAATLDSEAKQDAIAAAMQMVAETVEAQTTAKIAVLESKHAIEISQLQADRATMAVQKNSVGIVREWLNPIYENQNRNDRAIAQLQKHSANKRLLPLLLPAPTSDESNSKNSLQEYQQHYQRSVEVGLLKQRLRELESRLQNLQTDRRRVQPAGHLEPVYTPDQPLKPLYAR